jgi:hypothetical protein
MLSIPWNLLFGSLAFALRREASTPSAPCEQQAYRGDDVAHMQHEKETWRAMRGL